VKADLAAIVAAATAGTLAAGAASTGSTTVRSSSRRSLRGPCPTLDLGRGVVYLQDFKPIAPINFHDTNNTPTTTGFDSFFDNGVTMLAQVNLPTDYFGLPGHQGASLIYSTGDFISTRGIWEFVDSALVGELIPLKEKSDSWAFSGSSCPAGLCRGGQRDRARSAGAAHLLTAQDACA
jgi:hypothetical protein